jgi:pyruvate dehydrogenase E2 component (dihydrolipoamide acetyltransferase)
MQEILMPKLSDMMEEGKILSWSKQVGDSVAKGEAVAEVETEKVNIEITSFAAGTLRKILVPAGESAPVGAPIALVGSPTEPLDEPSTPAGDKNTAAASPAASANGSAAPGGVGAQFIAPTGTGAPTVAGAPAGAGMPAGVSASLPVTERGRVKASPLAKRLAEEYHLDLHAIHGTGPEGRIIRDDVEAAIAALASAPTATAPPQTSLVASQSAVIPNPSFAGEDVDVVPLSNMRRTIAQRLQQSMQTTPHFYVTMAMDADGLIAMRRQLNAALEAQRDDLRISYNDLIVMAVARTLTRHPEINVSWGEDRLLRHRSVHIGVAVALESGLIVPVVRDANKRGAADLAREIRRLSDAAHAGKLRPDEFSGGTFTISNLGMLDVESFTAIINPPEAAILAVGAIHQLPVVRDGQLAVGNEIKMTLSCDHRAIDGAQAAYFMRDLKHLIEAPLTMLLG